MFPVSILGAVLVAFLLSQAATTLYLHRSLTHRSMTLQPWLAVSFRVVLWLTTGLDRREWVAVHRKHHVYTDEAADPHSPVQRGVMRVFFFNAGYYRQEANRAGTVATYARDLPADRWDRVLFGKGITGPALGAALLVLLIGPIGAVVAASLHLVLYISQGGMVNSFGHHFGRRPHQNSATNLRWLALLTAGEGMHNEHHEYPRSPRFGNTWWDLGGKLANGLSLENRIRPVFIGREFGNYADRLSRGDVRYLLTYLLPRVGYEGSVIEDVLRAYPQHRVIQTFPVNETPDEDRAALIDKFPERGR